MFIVYLCDLTTRGTLMFLSGHASNLNTPEHLEASNPQIHHCCMFFCIFGGVPHAEGWRVPNGRFNRIPSKNKNFHEPLIFRPTSEGGTLEVGWCQPVVKQDSTMCFSS